MPEKVMPLVCAFAGAAATTWAITPLVARAAFRLGVVDHPGGRRVHTSPTPRLGGVAVALGLLVGASMYGFAFGHDALLGVLSKDELAAFLLPCLLVFLVGLTDDVRGLSPGPRIAAEAIAASFLVQAGYVIDNVANPFGAPIELGVFAYPITIAWFVGVTNAFNLIDGLDGLLGSVALAAVLGCAGVAVLGDRTASATLALALAGALSGFLFWNWRPARIFMGDSGSLLIGFSVAALSLKVARNPSGTLAFHVPLLLCGLPMFETVLTLARRHVSGQPYLSGDRSHIHHVLLNRGLSVRKAVLTLAAVGALLAGAAVASRNWREQTLLVASLGLLLLAGLALRWLGYLELRVLADRLGQLMRGRRALSDMVLVASAGEGLSEATSLDDLRARLRAAVTLGRFEFVALEFTPRPDMPAIQDTVECHNEAAARFQAARDGLPLWLFSCPNDTPCATGFVSYSIPLVGPNGPIGVLLCQRRLGSEDGSAGAITRFFAEPLVAALHRLEFEGTLEPQVG
ncbi:MAG: undecaprenyl/decaprenyl-phosphate alpha-N-acetylglucosaminyl 1-phosphate transferase [Planctomycetes bacterium]|nr:undecaprenyl/decaprenyl-phosphate alpha-N-acetylglucosaminyl 1-phosphate transferase [Planctomycetota bacterium]